MSYDIVRRSNGSIRRVSRQTSRDIEHVEDHAIFKAAKIGAIAFVGKFAMVEVADVSALEGHLIEEVPLAEPRLRAIGDGTTAAIVSEIARMGF